MAPTPENDFNIDPFLNSWDLPAMAITITLLNETFDETINICKI